MSMARPHASVPAAAPVMPLGNLIDAMRSIFYFDGTT
jgi:hypothetical protein